MWPREVTSVSDDHTLGRTEDGGSEQLPVQLRSEEIANKNAEMHHVSIVCTVVTGKGSQLYGD